LPNKSRIALLRQDIFVYYLRIALIYDLLFGEDTMPTAVEQLIDHLTKDIAALEERAKQAEAMLPHIAEKYRQRWRASMDTTLRQANELSELLLEIRKDHPGN